MTPTRMTWVYWGIAFLLGCGPDHEPEAVGTLRSASIHGSDDRLEVGQAPLDLQVAAESVPMLVRGLVKRGDTYVAPSQGTLGHAYSLCSEETFSAQLKVAECSAALIAPDLVLTAGHCVQQTPGPANTPSSSCPKGLSAVFGYRIDASGQAPLTFPAADVYKCKAVRFSHYEPGGVGLLNVRKNDFALIQLDRPVQGRLPLRVRKAGSPRTGDDLAVVGYPEGLPQKVTLRPNAVIGSYDPFVLISNVDVFPGNSGSPLINASTLEIEGVVTAELGTGFPFFLKDPSRRQCWSDAERGARGTYCRTGCYGNTVFAESERQTVSERSENIAAVIGEPLRPLVPGDSDIIGQIDRVETALTGTVTVTGFACARSGTLALNVLGFLDGAKGPGTLIGYARAGGQLEPTLAAFCGKEYGRFKLVLPLTPAETGRPLFVQGFGTEGGANSVLRFAEGVAIPPPGSAKTFPIETALVAPRVHSVVAAPAAEVQRGQQVTLSASAEGDRLSFSWSKVGSAALAESARRIGTRTASLTLTGLLPSESGEYLLTVTDAAGFSAQSLPVAVLVRGPQILRALPTTLTVPSGASSELQLQLYDQGNAVEWLISVGGRWVPVTATSTVQPLGERLRFVGGTSADSGLYRAKVTRDGLQTLSTVCSVTVE